MNVVQFRRRSSLAVTDGYGPDEILFGAWLCRSAILWMGRTPADLRRVCLLFLSADEIDDLESQRSLSRRKTANGR